MELCVIKEQFHRGTPRRHREPQRKIQWRDFSSTSLVCADQRNLRETKLCQKNKKFHLCYTEKSPFEKGGQRGISYSCVPSFLEGTFRPGFYPHLLRIECLIRNRQSHSKSEAKSNPRSRQPTLRLMLSSHLTILPLQFVVMFQSLSEKE